MGEIGHHIDFMIPQNGVGLMVLNHCPYRLYYLRGLRPPVGKITNKNGFSPGVLPYPVNTAVIHLRQQGRQFAVVTMHIANDVEIGRATRLNSSHVRISYAVFCLKKKKRDMGRAVYKGDVEEAGH